MKVFLAASGLLLVPPCERPPIEFQGPSVPAIVMFADPAIVDAVCRRLVPSANPKRVILACTNPATGAMLLPDPCLYEDGMAKLLCHEVAHLKRADGSPGWVHQ